LRRLHGWKRAKQQLDRTSEVGDGLILTGRPA